MENTSPTLQSGAPFPTGGMTYQTIGTDGGAHVAGDVYTGGGDFVGRDQNVRSIIAGRE
jgi:hypothetical protein